MLKITLLHCLLATGLGFSAQRQVPTGQIKPKVDAVVLQAYASASAQFPCKVKSGGKPKMIRWQDVGKCLSDAYEGVDWEDVSQQLQAIRKEFSISASDMLDMAEQSLSSHALQFDKVFAVKDESALLPLSNPVLKFLPDGSLQDFPVIEKSAKKEVGKFSGTYAFERTGDVSGNRNRLILFQYTDQKGNIHSATERLLLDTFGVPWKDAMSQPGFRLPPDRLAFK